MPGKWAADRTPGPGDGRMPGPMTELRLQLTVAEAEAQHSAADRPALPGRDPNGLARVGREVRGRYLHPALYDGEPVSSLVYPAPPGAGVRFLAPGLTGQSRLHRTGRSWVYPGQGVHRRTYAK
jgi:hypothetical protein